MTEFTFQDVDGNEYSVNGSGISTIVANTLAYEGDGFTWDSKIVGNSFLPGSVKLGISRLAGRTLAFSATFVFTTDADFRTDINALIKAFNSVYYLVDVTNSLRAKAAPGKLDISHNEGMFRRMGTISFTVEVLSSYWETLDETSVSAYCPATTYTQLVTDIVGALKPQPRIIIDSNKFTQVGNTLSIASIASPRMATLSTSRIAYFDSGLKSLRAYDFDGTNWTLTGSGLSLGSNGITQVIALNSTDVALFDATSKTLQAYRFNGATWATLGSALTVTTNVITSAGGCALSASDIALVIYSVTTGATTLARYTFNGSTWAIVGTTLSNVLVTTPKIAFISTDRVAVYDGNNNTVTAYDWDTTNLVFGVVGNSFSTVGYVTGTGAICAYDTNTIFLYGATTTGLYKFAFDGTNWRPWGTVSGAVGTNTGALCQLSSTCFVFISESAHLLTTYSWGVDQAVSSVEFFTPVGNESLTLLDTLLGTGTYTEEIVDNEQGTVTLSSLSRENIIDSATGYLELDDGTSYIRAFPNGRCSVTVAWRERYYV